MYQTLMEESDSFDGFDVTAGLVTSTCIGCVDVYVVTWHVMITTAINYLTSHLIEC